MFAIVPNFVSEAINAKLDKALKDCPEAEKKRSSLFSQLLSYFDEHGELPDFTLTKKEEPNEPTT
jgi:hypothetical protein